MFSKRLLSFTRFSNLEFYLTVLFGWLGGAITILQAWFLSRIVNDVFLDKVTLDKLSEPLLFLLACTIGKSLFVFISEYSSSRLSIRIRQALRSQVLEKLSRLGPSYSQSERTGELAMTSIDGIESIDSYFSQYLPQLIFASSIPLTVLFFVFPIDSLSGVVFLLTAPLVPFFMIMIGKYGESLTQKQYSSLSIISAHFFDVLQGITTLKVFGQSKKQVGVIEEISEQYRAITMKVLRVTFLSSFALELLTTLSTAIIAVEIGFRLIYGYMEFQPAFFILILAPEFYFPLRQLGLKFHAGMTGITAAARVFEIMDEPELEKTVAVSDQPQVDLSTLDRIAFTNVNFEYPGRSAFGLININLEIKAGALTALVGKTGAGKSTIINMLLRFSQPQSGEILWDGLNIENIPLETYRSQIAWVPQNPFLFFDSIKNNLLVANPNASEDEIRQACAKASILEFIDALPQGFDTKIGERGSRLSGGQAQRIALARGFLKNAPIVIFDEPTANLDPKLENDLIRSLQELAKGKTVLVIAHRLKTVLTADKICFLEQGEILEQGTHLELMKKQGRYANFISEQASSAFESENLEAQL